MVHENNNPTANTLTFLSGQIAALDAGLKLDKKELDLIQLKINWHIAVDLERLAEQFCIEEEIPKRLYTDEELIAELRNRGRELTLEN